MRLRVVFLLIVTITLSSCGFLGLRRIEVGPTPILTAGSGWGLVKSSYVRVKASASGAGQDVAALRDGSLVQVLGREYARDGAELWYHVSSQGVGVIEGWVPETELTLYASRSQAERALRLRTEKPVP